MIIKAFVTHVAMDEPIVKEYTVDIPEHASLQDLFNALGYGLADVSDYYALSGVFAWNDFYCPFLLTENGIFYNVPYTDTKLVDFFNTHGITNNEIQITTGHIQAGGPGFIALLEIWNAVAPYLNAISIFCSISGISVKSMIEDIKKHFIKKNVPPHTVIDLLSSREQWNHKELADMIKIPEENAQNLLKAFGYTYNRKLMQYVPSEKADELKEKMRSVQVHDI